MSIKVIKAGMCSTVQDLGRKGYRSLGVGTGGAMDLFASHIASCLVGNKENEPVIEMHFPAAEILFQSDILISITGANFDAIINDVPVEMYQPLFVKSGAVLSFKKNITGARAYISFGGKMKIEKWLGNYSTNLKVKAGGYQGRALQKEDIIEFEDTYKPVSNNAKFFISPPLIKEIYADDSIIHCIRTEETNLIDPQNLTDNSFLISSQSDRMGYRLVGENIVAKNNGALVSSPVTFGTVQLLPNGQLIILMADHQTTGGYPRIATVVAADLPKLAQLPTNSKISFQLVSLQQAEEMLFSMRKKIAEIKNGCNIFYDKH